MEIIIKLKNQRLFMISLETDVSKEKSTVCIVKPFGEIIIKPFEVAHTKNDLNSLLN